MTEAHEPQPLPLELQQPPALNDSEAQAVAQTQAAIRAARQITDEDGGTSTEYIMGITYDGIMVSVDSRPRSSSDDHFFIRVAPISELSPGEPIPLQKLPLELPHSYRLRDGGSTTMKSAFGTIHLFAPKHGKLPQLEGKVLFPIGEDGRPFSPAAKRAAEATAKREEAYAQTIAQHEQLGVSGIRRFLRRHR